MAAIQQNYRVVIEIDSRRFTKDKRAFAKSCLSDCEDIKNQIKRHIDGAGGVYIESDTQCEFCNCDWELDPETGAPVCCDKAVTEFDAAKAVRPVSATATANT